MTLILRKSVNFLNPNVLFKMTTCNSSILNEAREKLQFFGEGKIHFKKDEDSGIATITIDNAQKKNAISGVMMTELEKIVDQLEKWESGKGIILRSEGNFFCSGGDISQVGRVTPTPETGLLMSTFMHHILTRFNLLPMITVCLVHGRAIGGGAELTTATDFRVFTETGEVTFVQGKMGLVTGWGGSTRLVNILGPKVSLDLLVSSRKMGYEEAMRIGYADNIVTSENNVDETEKWLKQKLIHHYSIIQAFKKIVVKARDVPVEESLLFERNTFAPFWGGPVNLKALEKNIKH